MSNEFLDQYLKLSDATRKQYSRMAIPYFLKYEALYCERPIDDVSCFMKFLKSEIDHKLSRATLRLLRVSLRWILRINGVKDSSYTMPTFIPVEKGHGSLRGGKLKRIPLIVANAMRKDAFTNKRYSIHARLAVMIMYSSIFFGLRPAEWFCAEFSADGRELIVTNAKFNPVTGRGFSTHRIILISDSMPEDVLEGTRWLLAEIEKLGYKKSHPSDIDRDLMESLANCLSRVYENTIKSGMAVKSKKGHRCTMYTGRHQFSADAKKAGLSKQEVAALMGHASVDSAGQHYGKTRNGRNGIHVYPHPENVAAVEQILEKKSNNALPKFVI